jgi:hypothetical protein
LLIPHRGRRWRLAPDFLGTAPKHCCDRTDEHNRRPQGVTGCEIEREREAHDEPQNRVAEFGGSHLPPCGAQK